MGVVELRPEVGAARRRAAAPSGVELRVVLRRATHLPRFLQASRATRRAVERPQNLLQSPRSLSVEVEAAGDAAAAAAAKPLHNKFINRP